MLRLEPYCITGPKILQIQPQTCMNSAEQMFVNIFECNNECKNIKNIPTETRYHYFSKISFRSSKSQQSAGFKLTYCYIQVHFDDDDTRS